MADENKNNLTGSDHVLMIGAILFFVWAIVSKFLKWLVIWIKNPVHQLYTSLLAGVLVFALYIFIALNREKYTQKIKKENMITGDDENAVFCGFTDKRKPVFIKPKQRAMHTQVIGTTNAG